MTSIEQPCYTLLNYPSSLEQPNEMQLKADLENGSTKTKVRALKNVIHLIANGERLPGILMHIIRFVLPSQDHTIKNLLLLFWELVPKTTADGKLLQEMILVCDAYRKDLQHPNEFIRGSTLRFLCKLKEPELLEPLMPSIRSCLEHKISYVRRNAVLAIFTIYKNFEFLIPDAPELIANFLDGEQDMSCKRNAFLMLLHADQDKALSYLVSCLEQVSSFGDILQLVIVQLIYKVCQANPSERSRFIRCIYSLLNASSPSVRYEAAGTLITLSNAPTAVKAAASSYIELIVKESDNNVKLIVLDRLIALKQSPTHEKVLQELVMDILRVLSSPDIEVKNKTLQLVLDLTTPQFIEEVVTILKKEMQKTNDFNEQEDMGKYRQLLVRSLHSCSIKFPEVAPAVIPVLMEFLTDPNEMGSYDIIVFVREAVHKFGSLRALIIRKLLEVLPTIKSAKVHRVALWILSEYSFAAQEIQEVMKKIKYILGDIPLTDTETTSTSVDHKEQLNQVQNKLVTSDGTYATQSTFNMETSTRKEDHPPLKQYLINGDFFIGTSIASTLTKLGLRYKDIIKSEGLSNGFISECMLVISSIINLGKSGLPSKSISKDDVERMLFFIRVLSDQNPVAVEIFTTKCRNALVNMQAAKENAEAMVRVKEKSIHTKEVDDPISFLQLSPKESDLGTENVFESSLSQAVSGANEASFSVSKLSKITQLTGFSDPVYAEAFVNVNQYDIVLDVLIVNKTSDTLQNCIIEFVTQGDLKLVDKPQPFILAPYDFTSIKTSIKVASTENSIIFGNITYEVCGAVSEGNVVLNDILVDIMDYIVPSPCADSEFIRMWAEFEWENKVFVSTNINDLLDYLNFVMKTANMKCLTPEEALSGQCGLMAANLYARSIFGEDILANLSIEKSTESSPIVGHVRLRAKSRGIALSLGDKISKAQKLHNIPAK